MTAATMSLAAQKRRRELVTPEGLSLPFTVASRGARASALIADIVIIAIAQFAFILLMIALASGLTDIDFDDASPALEFLIVVFLLMMLVFHYGYFLFFELGPRGATPGKRMAGIRIAARNGGRLSVESVIARNLLRDIELFLPLGLMNMGDEGGWAGLAALVWFLTFTFFIFFNKDAMRAGDLIAGTFVVEVPRRKLAEAMSVGEAAKGRSIATGAEYRFGDAELRVYGEYELQTLERVLRQGNEDALVSVAEAICAKIGWSAGSGDERAFLEAFYAQLRARLERDMRFGKRKADKFS